MSPDRFSLFVQQLPKSQVARFCRSLCASGWVSAFSFVIAAPLIAAEPAENWFPNVKGVHRPISGIESCTNCHAQQPKTEDSTQDKSRDDLNYLRGLEAGKWVLFSEFMIWNRYDKHFQAYAVLSDEQSQHMGKLLGTDVTRDVRCLACHTGIPVQDMPKDAKGQLAQLDPTNILMKEILGGITCEGCHGPSSDGQDNEPSSGLKGWYGPHLVRNTSWRHKTQKEKRDVFGLVDVRSPSAQAEMCLSCHLGDAAMGRVVTHEMYAAGHPPLPGFESYTFGTQMPKHWRRFEEKPEAMRADVLKYATDIVDPGPIPHTRQLLVGGVVNLQKSLQLMHDLPTDSVALPEGITRPEWPEFAVFECSACHHELKVDSWRQKRSTGFVVGRPYPREWTTILVEVALETVGRNPQELHDALAGLQKGLSGRPFGTPADLAPAYLKVVEWCRTLASELEHREWKATDVDLVLRSAARLGQDRLLEYDTFRQLLWAAQTALGESKSQPEEAQKFLAELNAFALVDLHTSRLPFGTSPDAVADVVKTQRLPLATARVQVNIALSGDVRNILELDFDKVLPPIAKYDPRQTQELFAKFAKSLP